MAIHFGELNPDVSVHLGVSGRLYVRSVSVDWVAVGTDEEFLVVPPDILHEHGAVQGRCHDHARGCRTQRLEICVHGMLLSTVDVNLPREREARHEAVPRPHVVDPVHQFHSRPRGLLEVKLITRESNDLEALSTMLGLECIQSMVLEYLASVCRHVDGERQLATELGHIERLVVEDVSELEIVS